VIGRFLCLIGLHKEKAVQNGPDLDWRAALTPKDQLNLMMIEKLMTDLHFVCARCGQFLH